MTNKILLVEASDMVRHPVADLLRHHGFDVTEAADGEAALDLLAAAVTYDAVVTDIELSEADGLALVHEVRKDERYAAAPVIVLTPEPEPARQREAHRAGATGALVRPFDGPRLLAELGRALGESAVAPGTDPVVEHA
ncbi:response regulator [Streptomyces sp. J2-1]|uniref:response regulator n=1 Tax=Streptomyces corallincola TaxID=2851888 RepID=UPI001C389B74|nr:response regulator [Streptomyces corallincola]MBV2354114.1 response regulator [Streptomyces corallincola]